MYLDTSALVALYVPEPLSEAVARVVGREPPAISALTEVEFASALARRRRERSIPAADCDAVLQAFDTHLSERRFRRLPVAADTFAHATAALRAGKAPLSTLDALHLSAAALAGETLVTADRQLARAARAYGVRAKLVS